MRTCASRRFASLFAFVCLAAACQVAPSAPTKGDDDRGAGDVAGGDAAEPTSGDTLGGDAAAGDSAAGADAAPGGGDGDSTTPVPWGCEGTTPSCSAWNERRMCTPTVTGPHWEESACPAGCRLGTCTASACTDECPLGTQSPAGTCRLWSVSEGAEVAADPVGSMVDRARGYEGLLRGPGGPPDGAILDWYYTDPSRTTLQWFTSIADAALWTGTGLAMQAWRLEATGAADARVELGRAAHTLHTWLNVSGDPGYLARFALPSSSNVLTDTPCGDGRMHCGVSYEGGSWNWMGVTSRDQYTGVMLGYAMAYEVADEDLRALLRDDVVELVTELMREHTVPMRVKIDAVQLNTSVVLENVVMAPSELVDGRVYVEVDTGDSNGTAMERGIREFLPDIAVLLRQLPLLGWAPAVRRSSSAVMLGGFFRMALHMTEGVPGYQAVHEQIDAYYQQRADDWIDASATWSYDNDCGAAYYGNHIAYIMAYVWARLEPQASRRARLTSDVVGAMHDVLGTHKNPYFTLLWAGASGIGAHDARVEATAAQLAQFGPPPRVHTGVDNLDAYAHDPECTINGHPSADRNGPAVDVGQRVIDGILWQREPWGLKDDGDPRRVFTGIDYLAAYWAGRAHGLLADDRPGTCTRWLR